MTQISRRGLFGLAASAVAFVSGALKLPAPVAAAEWEVTKHFVKYKEVQIAHHQRYYRYARAPEGSFEDAA